MVKKYEHSHLISKAKTGAGRRAVASRMPQLIETPKTLLLLKGHSTSSIGLSLLSDIQSIKKPYCHKLMRKNDVLPFESGGEAHLENLCRLNDASLFALANHTKKRPHNLILGRAFDHRLLDMIELGISSFKPMAMFPPPKTPPGCPNVITFNGGDFEASEDLQTIRSVLIDIFRFPTEVTADEFEPASVCRSLVFSLKGDKLLLRHYAIESDGSSGSKKSSLKLTECGPSVDFIIRRVQNASPGLLKVATRKPKDPDYVHKKKNISRDDLGDKVGRIHVGQQDLSSLALARMKGLGKKRSADDKPEKPDTDDEDTAPVESPSHGGNDYDGPEIQPSGDGSPVSDFLEAPSGSGDDENNEGNDPPLKKVKVT